MAGPNAIVIMVDQMKATASGLYGNSACPTPALEMLAARGTTYETAITPHPLCVPARIALWTSQFPDRNGCRTNERLLPAGRAHAFRTWHDAGYETALIGKNHCFSAPEDLARFDVWCEIGHRGLTEGGPHKGMDWVHPPAAVAAAHATRLNMFSADGMYVRAVTDYPLEHYSTGLVTDQACAYLDRVEKPFALWLSYPDPHTPYEVPRRYADMVDWRTLDLPPAEVADDPSLPARHTILRSMLGAQQGDLDGLRQALAIYYAMVRFMDDGVGRVLAKLAERGLDRDTVVIFCSDHGDFSGEHRMMNKGGLFYDCLTRVPLVVSWPGHLPEGRRVAAPVSLLDIVPTLFALQQLGASEDWDGRPLPGVTDAPAREEAYSIYGAGGPAFTVADWAQLPVTRGNKALMGSLKPREAEGERSMVRTCRHKFVHDLEGYDPDELYDLETDPYEIHNLAGLETYAALETELHDKLIAFRRRPGAVLSARPAA